MLAPVVLDAGVLWIGYSKNIEVEVINLSRVTVDVELRGEGAGVSVSPAMIGLGPAATESVSLELWGFVEGPLEQAKLIGSEGGFSKETLLTGRVRRPPSCASSSACTRALFNPVAGKCEQVVVEDGVACDDKCTSRGACMAGLCVGEPITCPAPTSSCKEAACSAAIGCFEVDKTCEPTSACVEATCLEGQGCVETPVDDGKSCGEPHCDQDYICLNGGCRQATPPEGLTVERCLRARQVLVTEEGMTCAVTLANEGVCWGAVKRPFSKDLTRRSSSTTRDEPAAISLGLVERLMNAGVPLCVERLDGGVYCKASYLEDVRWLKHWRSPDAGMLRLSPLDGAKSIMRFQDSLCAAFATGEVRCGGADLVYAPPGDVGRLTYAVDGGELLPGRRAVSVHGSTNGIEHWACALLDDGTIACRDPIGFGTTNLCRAGMSADSFQPFGGFHGAVSLTTWSRHACASTTSGTVICRGNNSSFQLGARPRTVPCLDLAPVPGLSNVAKVVDRAASCAVKRDGELWCWGEIGFAKEDPFALDYWPRRVAGFREVEHAHFGYGEEWRGTLCAIRRDGLVKCVGGNQFGQAGYFREADGGEAPEFLIEPRALVLPNQRDSAFYVE